MADLKPVEHQQGYSLVEILVGAAIMGGAALVISQASTLSSKVNETSSLQTVIDSLHAGALHYARSPVNIKKALNIAGNAALRDCLARKGANCPAQFQTSWHTLSDSVGDLNAKFSKNQGKCSTGPDCVIQRQTQYQILCPSDHYCNKVEIKIETSYTGPTTKGNFTKRQATIPIPVAALSGRADIDFSCVGSDRFVSGVDYDRLVAECGTVSGTTVSAEQKPIRIFPISNAQDVQQLANANCSAGFGQAGLFAGQSSCSGSISSPTPSITPSPVVSPTSSTCDSGPWVIPGTCPSPAPTDGSKIVSVEVIKKATANKALYGSEIGVYDHCILYGMYYDGDGKTTCYTWRNETGVWIMTMQDEGDSEPVKCRVLCGNKVESGGDGEICTTGGLKGIKSPSFFGDDLCHAGSYKLYNTNAANNEKLKLGTSGAFDAPAGKRVTNMIPRPNGF